MFRVTRFTDYTTRGANRASALWQTAATQPNWVSRFALMTFIIVIGLPIFLLVIFAIFAATFVFAMLAGVNYCLYKIRGALPHSDGRKNVRVIRRDDDQTRH
ncbi:MAG: hypothetical protein IID30_11895 [Planctomycetes bacterium]|nr:hypothetical protein [Planctomycetota bacterium]